MTGKTYRQIANRDGALNQFWNKSSGSAERFRAWVKVIRPEIHDNFRNGKIDADGNS